MKKAPSFALWAALLTAIVLIGLCVAAVLRQGELVKTETGVVVLRLKEKQEPVEIALRSTPEPTAEPLQLPRDAVDVRVDRDTVALTLASETEAKTLLTDYLQKHMDGVIEGRALSAQFECEVHILPAAGKNPMMTYAEAMECLEKDPARIPVRLEVELRTVETDSRETETREEPALEKGAKFYTQLGSGALNMQRTVKTYIGGQLVGEVALPAETLFPARTTLLREGSYVPDKADQKEGVYEKPADPFTLSYPIKIHPSSYFGKRSGKLHRGVDLPAKAGTAIKAPAEGIVVYVGERMEYGTVIDIDHGNGFVSRLTHCQDVQVVLNQRVFAGDTLASLAPLAYGSGKPHLHYEVLIDGIPHNPIFYLKW